jgi:hypothetical protein
MAKKSTGGKKSSGGGKEVAAALKGVTGPVKPALTGLVQEGQAVQVVGRVRNGKLEIDPSSLKEFKRKFPNANITFVAVNAPFDPVPYNGNN